MKPYFLALVLALSSLSLADSDGVPDHCKKIDFYEDCVRDSQCDWDRIKESCVAKPATPELSETTSNN